MTLSILTPRQNEVANLLKEGLSNQAIGKQLSISTLVVKNYLREIYDRTGQFNRLELAVFMVNHEEEHKLELV